MDNPHFRHSAISLIVVASRLAFPWSGLSQTVSGVVLDTGTGVPIEGVSVMLLDSDERVAAGGLSGSSGEFLLDAPWTGRFRLRCERIGYAPTTSSEIDLLPPDTFQVELRLSVEAVELPPMTIVSEREALVIDPRMARWGYYDRRVQYGKSGTGRAHFLEYEDIQERRPGRVTDMFTALSGVKVIPTGRRGISVRSTRSALGDPSGRGCPLTFYLDGVRLTMDSWESINDYVVPPDLAAIEVYVRAPYPIEYAPAGNDCGCILVWTGWVEGKGRGGSAG